MKNRMIGIFLAILMSVNVYKLPVIAQEIPDELKSLYAQSAVLMDADSGRILFGKNEEKILPMASTTKIMTCIIALEKMGENQIIEASSNAVKQPKVHLGVCEGDEFYVKDLLYSLMLESHNDSAVMIAEAIGGTVEDFAALMNDKAKKIGCRETYFITPNGLDAKDYQGVHSTTAKDLALIMRYCIKDSVKAKEFLEVTRTKEYQFQNISKSKSYSCRNHNLFLDMMEGALTGKTGFTNDAGYCYVGALRQGNRTFIVSLLACGWPNNKSYKWEDTKRLMEYALERYEYRNILIPWENRKITVLNGAEKDKVEVCVEQKNKKLEVLLGEKEEVEIVTSIKQEIYAPVEKKQPIGKVIYKLDDIVICEFPIVAKENIEAWTVKWCLRKIMDGFCLIY